MKRKITTFICTIILPFLSIAQQNNRVIFNAWQKQAHAWMNPAEKTYDLRSLEYLVGERKDTFVYSNLTWSSSDSAEYTYYSADTSLGEKYELVNDVDSSWIDERVTHYYKDNINRDTTIIIQSWDNDNKFWVNQAKYILVYDANDNLLSNTFQIWDIIGLAWINSGKISNTYDANNNLLTTIFENANGASWDNSQKIEYTYDANNNRITEIDYTWGGGWNNDKKYTSGYDASNHHVETINQYWQTSSWKNSSRDSLWYDANDNLVLFERKDWVNNASDFVLADAKSFYAYDLNNHVTHRIDSTAASDTTYMANTDYTYAYDANGNNIYALYMVWSFSTYQFVNRERHFYYYSDQLHFTGITSVSNNAYIAHLFPNPATNVVGLSVNVEHSSDVLLQVLDMNGRILKEQSHTLLSGSNSLQLDVSKLASGVYYIRIYNPTTGAQSVNRLVKQ